ncbi:C3 and PZP-like alpha-2-macroglobulin domain-containing protein 8 [Ptychodera flava]|uniref:C3 and PZP-like alpha-2-macroglobulin domain-containing protein 8 n=1 Tax=Ptychodera flava TaxID=63121 RepID=UPI00396A49EA
MFRIVICVISVLCSYVYLPVEANNGYLVAAPTVFRPGVTETISITIFEATEPIPVAAHLVVHGQNIAFSQEIIFGKGQIKLEVPRPARGKATLKICGNCDLQAGGYTFHNYTVITIDEKGSSAFIQTDKPIYKPSQTVNINVFTTGPDLRPIDEHVEAYIMDPKQSRMIQWKNLKPLCCGIVNMSFPISDQPVLGEWMVIVEMGGASYNKSFEIQKYVLPKFEVTIDPPPYIVDMERCYDVRVEARYTYGELVQGKLTVSTDVIGVDYYNNFNSKQRDSQLMDIDGSVIYSVCMKNIIGIVQEHFRGLLRIEATVTSKDGSTSTGVVDSVPVNKLLVEIEYSKDTRKHFKPGLPYRGKLNVFYPDRSPVSGVTVQVKVEVSGENVYTKEFIAENGIVKYEIPSLPTSAQLVWLDARVIAIDGEDVSEKYFSNYKSISSWYAPSKCHIMLENLDDDIQAGDTAEVAVLSTCPCNFILHYEAMSRGNIVVSGSHNASHPFRKRAAHSDVVTFLDGQLIPEVTDIPTTESTPTESGTCQTHIRFDVTYDMAPLTKLLVYYVRENNEGVADSILIPVKPVFENQISVSLSKDEAYPSERIDVNLNAEPGSCVCLAAVDKSVHVFKPGYQLTAQEIFEELEEYDASEIDNEDTMFWGFSSRKRRNLLFWSSRDAHFAFVETGLTVMTDHVMLNHRQETSLTDGFRYLPTDWYQAKEANPQTYSTIPRAQRKKRTYFPETWIWQCFNVSSIRKHDHLKVKVPDTITSWMIDAVSVSKQYGLGIAQTSTLKTFKPFFVDFTMPYSVIRGEQVKLPVTVYNYLDVCAEVHLTVHIPVGVRFVSEHHRRTTRKLCLQARETQTTSVTMVFEDIGHKNITAHAEAFEAATCCGYSTIKHENVLVAEDKLSKQMLVEAEGIPRRYTHSVFFCQNERIQISTRDNYEYQYQKLPEGVTNFTFSTKAYNDVHLALSAVGNDLPEMYEIVIGGFQNTESWIARSKQGDHEIRVPTKDIVTWDEFKAFWVSWKDGYIQVGHGMTPSNDSVFLAWEDANPLTVMYIGFSTGWGSMGEFTIWKKENVESTYSEAFVLDLPLNVVRGSERTSISVTGDVMGPTLTNLHNLLRLPYGCGEQNMIHFAPNVYVLRYLKKTMQLTPETEMKALEYLVEGYQRQLTYKRKDGSYSAFGQRDSAGSMWLTAFVLKSFAQSRSFIYIDPKELEESVNWIIKYQKSDGYFPPVGKVINKDIQGGLKGRISLTAYVLVALLEVGMTGERESMAVQAAQKFLETYVETGQISDPYTAAQTAYALTLLKSKFASAAVRKLNTFAIKQGGFTYWRFSGHPMEKIPFFMFSDGLKHSVSSAEVEMTAYGLLTYTEMGDVASAFPVVKWLSKQRNSLGGFSSTQDTCVALQGLSEYATLAYIGNTNISITMISVDSFKTFDINEENSKVLQTDTITPTSFPATLLFAAEGEGEGCALLQIDVTYNIPDPTATPAFGLRVKMKEQMKKKKGHQNKQHKRSVIEEEFSDSNEIGEDYKVTLETCTRWLHPGYSNMAIIEVALLTGFRADIDSIEKLVNENGTSIKRYEVDGRKVLFYFDEIPSECLTCFSFEAFQDYVVGKTKPVPVTVYDYYEPTYEATRFYNVSRNSPLSQELCEGRVCNEVREESYSAFSTYVEEHSSDCNSVFGCFEMDEANIERCGCVRDCSYYVGSPVCGSDGIIYNNVCEMENAACYGFPIQSLPFELCEDIVSGDGTEEPFVVSITHQSEITEVDINDSKEMKTDIQGRPDISDSEAMKTAILEKLNISESEAMKTTFQEKLNISGNEAMKTTMEAKMDISESKVTKTDIQENVDISEAMKTNFQDKINHVTGISQSKPKEIETPLINLPAALLNTNVPGFMGEDPTVVTEKPHSSVEETKYSGEKDFTVEKENEKSTAVKTGDIAEERTTHYQNDSTNDKTVESVETSMKPSVTSSHHHHQHHHHHHHNKSSVLAKLVSIPTPASSQHMTTHSVDATAAVGKKSTEVVHSSKMVQDAEHKEHTEEHKENVEGDLPVLDARGPF